ncbi:Protein of unknown function [Gryllus bimaculatus]|nr:Protein of unknown function [Gryllus bimaculatus]
MGATREARAQGRRGGRRGGGRGGGAGGRGGRPRGRRGGRRGGGLERPQAGVAGAARPVAFGATAAVVDIVSRNTQNIQKIQEKINMKNNSVHRYVNNRCTKYATTASVQFAADKWKKRTQHRCDRNPEALPSFCSTPKAPSVSVIAEHLSSATSQTFMNSTRRSGLPEQYSYGEHVSGKYCNCPVPAAKERASGSAKTGRGAGRRRGRREPALWEEGGGFTYLCAPYPSLSQNKETVLHLVSNFNLHLVLLTSDLLEGKERLLILIPSTVASRSSSHFFVSALLRPSDASTWRSPPARTARDPETEAQGSIPR